MAAIKHTKNELKAQRDALTRFERFLPMLQLKKQQLQAELQAIQAVIDQKAEVEKQKREQIMSWARLFSEPVGLEDMMGLPSVQTEEGNIAGVRIPILQKVDIERGSIDLFETPSWVDDAMDAIEDLVRLKVEREILEEQYRLIAEELRTTSQRVNLFEKVKIPECREHIRIIKIFLGDEQTAAVVRGKIAKKRGA
ncbi:MAG: V-type ATP synthase subunit D [Kiritimatiellia bacterium]|jgi:V/A-type H+-transporting ATPase subunit D|nr:V-type ATP synthase subunit D [Kiritimatiellia bacterium]